MVGLSDINLDDGNIVKTVTLKYTFTRSRMTMMLSVSLGNALLLLFVPFVDVMCTVFLLSWSHRLPLPGSCAKQMEHSNS